MTNKDVRIVNVVNHLQQKFGATNILIKDYWDADNCAIGLTDKTSQFLVYISSFGKDDDRYFIALENLLSKQELPYESAGNFDNKNLVELEELLAKHLRLQINH